MLNHKTSNIHQVIAQMIKGDFDDDSNWQMVEYVFDKINSEGCGFGIRFYNTLLEALWWLGQEARAARVLKEATKRGLFPELFRTNKLVWSLDLHRYTQILWTILNPLCFQLPPFWIEMINVQDVAWKHMRCNISLAQWYVKDVQGWDRSSATSNSCCSVSFPPFSWLYSNLCHLSQTDKANTEPFVLLSF